MHIPDGFLNLPSMVSTGAVSLSLFYPALKKLNRKMGPERIPLMGLSAAFVFTAQLMSFPVFGGTSVHLTGAVLISILLGPFSGFLVTASAVMLQAFLFQHGGIVTLGANIFNIAVVQSLLGYLIFRIFSKRFYMQGAFISSFFAVVTASFFCATELIYSGTIPLKSGMIAMVTSHLIAGFIEGSITVLILGTIKKLKPGLLEIEKI